MLADMDQEREFATSEQTWRLLSSSLALARASVMESARQARKNVSRSMRRSAHDLLKKHPPASFQELFLGTLLQLNVHPDTFERGLEGQVLHEPAPSLLLNMLIARPKNQGHDSDPVPYRRYDIEKYIGHMGDLSDFLYKCFEYDEGSFATFWISSHVLWGANADLTSNVLHVGPANTLPLESGFAFYGQDLESLQF